ncbi:glycosyltransferase family 32 protein [Swingsia samuiensis]|uniref:Uncharacterized protein n=1 Tax=Swingsia samuiensis TaxID=1293412 RepID=A0A4Y6UJI8_9PROT|nr:hypothetical protein [Swingsia samuiensis]QDH16980.1 hypothetical protein E3D00_04945 [Swingsia samuiensis]
MMTNDDISAWDAVRTEENEVSTQENRKKELIKLLDINPRAKSVYDAKGCETVEACFELANILHTDGQVLEAASFYGEGFDLHDKNPAHYPLAQSFLQTKLLCLMKAGHSIEEKDLDTLKSFSIPYYNFIKGIQLGWQQNNVDLALETIGNAYEEFHTGEEIDNLYLELALKKFGSSLFGEVKGTSIKKIPNNLFFYWDKNPPEEIQQNIDYHQSIESLSVKVFDKEEAAEWLYENYGLETRELFLSARHPAEAADFLRVHVINLLGGWWLDADIRLSQEGIKFIDSVNSEGVYFLTRKFVVHNDFFGSAENNPILNDCLLSLYRNSYLHKGLFIAYKTGPGVFNRAFNRLIHRRDEGLSMENKIEIYSQDDFNQYIEEFHTPYKHILPSWYTA